MSSHSTRTLLADPSLPTKSEHTTRTLFNPSLGICAHIGIKTRSCIYSKGFYTRQCDDNVTHIFGRNWNLFKILNYTFDLSEQVM